MRLGASFRVAQVLCDTSYCQIDFIDYLQDHGYHYIMTVPFSNTKSRGCNSGS